MYFLKLLFDINKPSRQVSSVDSGSKFYWLPPNKENNANNPYSELGNIQGAQDMISMQEVRFPGKT